MSATTAPAHQFVTEVVTEAATAEMVGWVVGVSLAVIAASWVVPRLVNRQDAAALVGWALARFAAIAALFALVTVHVMRSGWLTGADARTLDWVAVHRDPLRTTMALAVSDVGGPVGVVVIGVGIAGVVAWRRRMVAAAALVILVVAIAAAASTAMKHVVGRGRPPAAQQLASEVDFSYPSGHVTATTALVGVVLLLYLVSRPGGWRAAAASVAATCVVLIAAASRLYLGVHWVSDVLGGALLGSAVVAAAACVTTAFPAAFRARPAPVAPPEEVAFTRVPNSAPVSRAGSGIVDSPIH